MVKLPPNSNERKRRDEITDLANRIEWLSRKATELIQIEGGILRDENILIYHQINSLSNQLLMLTMEWGTSVRRIERPMRRLQK